MEHFRLLRNLQRQHVIICNGRFKSDSNGNGKKVAKEKLLSLLSDMAVGNKNISEGTSGTRKLSKPKERPVKEENIEMSVDVLHDDVTMSVEALASKVTGETVKVQSELAKRLQMQTQAHDVKKHDSVRKLFEGMHVEPQEHERMQYTKSFENFSKMKPPSIPSAKDTVAVFLSGSPLNVFTSSEEKQSASQQEFNLHWEKLQEIELQSLSHFSPNNAFEEMIQWTEEGKHWKFPIDNEAGNPIEDNTHFSEHVFLDQHLDNFPKSGPIRRFMELVVTGMSRNSFITAQRKRENIKWYYDYFKEKESILKDYEYEVLDEK